MQLTGAEIVIECLKEQGVDTVFGYPGGTILNIYDELYKHQGEIHHVLTSHEQGAGFHPSCGYYLQRWPAPSGKRQFPGGGYCRSGHAYHQAQLYRKGRNQSGKDHPESL